MRAHHDEIHATLLRDADNGVSRVSHGDLDFPWAREGIRAEVAKLCQRLLATVTTHDLRLRQERRATEAPPGHRIEAARRPRNRRPGDVVDVCPDIRREH